MGSCRGLLLLNWPLTQPSITRFFFRLPPKKERRTTWSQATSDMTGYVVYIACEASLQVSEVTEKDWMNIPGGLIWEVRKVNSKSGRGWFDPVGERRHDKANFACFADILNLLRNLIRRRTNVWLACSRRSDSRAREKNSGRKKTRGD